MFREVFYSKSHRWNRSHCRDRYLFFLPPKDGVKGGKQVYAYVLHVIHKRPPHPPKYGRKSQESIALLNFSKTIGSIWIIKHVQAGLTER